ncbi:TetR/AcrR family transcriptional regulator [Bacteroides sp.]
MATSDTNENLEKKIIEAAKQLFIENGFKETSMSDIATKVGINRPALHYYFRTKDKMFQAVFGNIILSFVPKVHDIILQKDIPLSERFGKVIDAYFKIFIENPCLPMFMIREIHRDTGHLINAISELHIEQYFHKIIDSLQEEMDCGRLKPVPLPFVFYTFYGLLAAPFLTRNLSLSAFVDNENSFEDMFAQWKPYIIMQMEALLGPLPNPKK